MATFVIGDIHGCLEQFDAILAAVNLTSADQIITLGDYIDRGPDSAGVIKRLLRLQKSNALIALKGNHEQMLLDARANQISHSEWLLNGGDATLQSYNGVRGTLKDIPSEHFHFLENDCRSFFETPFHFFVHANADPDLPLCDQPDYMLFWERFDSNRPHFSGKTMVCGHTPQKSGKPRNLGYAICIDTDVNCKQGCLTCLNVDNGKIWQANSRGNIIRAHIADFTED